MLTLLLGPQAPVKRHVLTEGLARAISFRRNAVVDTVSKPTVQQLYGDLARFAAVASKPQLPFRLAAPRPVLALHCSWQSNSIWTDMMRSPASPPAHCRLIKVELSRGELSREFDAKLGSISAAFYPYLFGSARRGNLETQNINGIQIIDATSVGIGLSNNLGFNPTLHNSSINAEFAKDFSNIPFRHDGYRGNFSVALRF